MNVAPWGQATAAPDDPRTCAQDWLARTGRRLTYWRQQWYEYAKPGVWSRLEDGLLSASLWEWFGACHFNGKNGPQDWLPNPRRIADVCKALEALTVRADADLPSRKLSFANGYLDLDTMEMSPHTPDVFNLHQIQSWWTGEQPTENYNRYMADTFGEREADEWVRFEQIMGYLLSGDRSLQKIFLFYGPPRSGKGTAQQLLKNALGVDAVASPSLESLAEPFGLQSCVDASVIMFNEAQFDARNRNVAVSRLKAISGGDPVDVNRKNKPQLPSVQLPGRILMASNELPVVYDASGAMAGRIEPMSFPNSKLGKEDPKLLERMLPELPGMIWHWLTTYRAGDLQANGFRVTGTSRKAKAVTEVRTAGINSWAKQCLTRMPGERETNETLYASYVAYCQDNDVTAQNVKSFGRHMSGAGWEANKSNGVRGRMDCRLVDYIPSAQDILFASGRNDDE